MPKYGDVQLYRGPADGQFVTIDLLAPPVEICVVVQRGRPSLRDSPLVNEIAHYRRYPQIQRYIYTWSEYR